MVTKEVSIKAEATRVEKDLAPKKASRVATKVDLENQAKRFVTQMFVFFISFNTILYIG